MRGQVAKYINSFREYVRIHGKEVVKEILVKGHCKRGHIKCGLNKKDRFQMIKELGL